MDSEKRIVKRETIYSNYATSGKRVTPRWPVQGDREFFTPVVQVTCSICVTVLTSGITDRSGIRRFPTIRSEARVCTVPHSGGEVSDFGQPRILSATYDDKLQEIVFITHSSLGDTQLKVLTREVGPLARRAHTTTRCNFYFTNYSIRTTTTYIKTNSIAFQPYYYKYKAQSTERGGRDEIKTRAR